MVEPEDVRSHQRHLESWNGRKERSPVEKETAASGRKRRVSAVWYSLTQPTSASMTVLVRLSLSGSSSSCPALESDMRWAVRIDNGNGMTIKNLEKQSEESERLCVPSVP